MDHDCVPAPPHCLEIHSRRGTVRFVRMLLVLCAMPVVWGCAGRTEAPPTSSLCPKSVQAKVSLAKPTVKVSYVEPSVTVTGASLNDLAKTNIYYDLGHGRMLAKEVPATKPSGGGQVSQTITVPIQTQGEQSVRICVTATDRHGNESAMTP